jgi:hypothetical protein
LLYELQNFGAKGESATSLSMGGAGCAKEFARSKAPQATVTATVLVESIKFIRGAGISSLSAAISR